MRNNELFVSRDLCAARSAYSLRDIEASRQAHQQTNESANEVIEDNYSAITDFNVVGKTHSNVFYRPQLHSEKHRFASSECLKAFVFGGLDGIVTIFAIVAGCAGAQLRPIQIVVISLGNILADAVSMAFGEYVSAKAERDFIISERRREEWEVENCPQEEKNEMVEIYTGRYGFSLNDAQDLVEITYKYKDFFIEHMMVEELGLMSDEGQASPLLRGMIMFSSFCLLGSVPLMGIFFWHLLFVSASAFYSFLVAAIVSVGTLFVLGFFKGQFIGQNAVYSGLLMSLNGSLAGSVAFFIGLVLQKWAGGEPR